MSSIHITPRRLTSAMAMALVVFMTLLGQTAAGDDADKTETAEQKLLRIVSTASPDAMRAAYGLDADLLQRIMDHRKAGKTFSTAKELQDVTGVTPAQILALEEAGKGETPVPPPPDGSPAQPRERLRTIPSDVRDGQEEKTPLVSNIRPGFYGKLPGYEDLDKIDPLLKKEFLERMNYEKCPCGCENETLAFCLVNDPGCPVVKARSRKIYDEVVSKAKSGEPQK